MIYNDPAPWFCDGGGYSPSAAINAFVAGYAPSLRAEKYLVVLQAYIDDSASEEGDRPFFLAGYVASANDWAAFSHEWDFALRKRPAIEYFHMQEAESLRGPFKGWTREARNKKVLAMADVLNRNRPFGIECSISRKKYATLVLPVAPYELKSPYFICFIGIIHSLARWHEGQGIKLPVDFIFDDQGTTGTDALLWYSYMRKQHFLGEWEKLIGGTPQFKNDKQILPLQAADMLAWHLRRRSTPRFLDRHQSTLDKLLAEGCLSTKLPDEVLIRWRDNFAKIPGIAFTQDEKGYRARAPFLRYRLAAGLGPPSPWENFAYRFIKPIFVFAYVKGLRVVRKSRRLLRIVWR